MTTTTSMTTTNSTIINGFCIEMTSNEIVEHLRARAADYDRDAEELGATIRRRLEHDDREDRPSRLGEVRPQDRDLEAVHAARYRAAELRLMADHVVPDAIYRLDADDLKYLEIVEDGGWLLTSRRRRR